MTDEDREAAGELVIMVYLDTNARCSTSLPQLRTASVSLSE